MLDQGGIEVSSEFCEANLELVMSLSRSYGLAHWTALGKFSSNAATVWVCAIDRATEAISIWNFQLAIENLHIAKQVEEECPEFKVVAERVLKMLEGVFKYES